MSRHIAHSHSTSPVEGNFLDAVKAYKAGVLRGHSPPPGWRWCMRGSFSGVVGSEVSSSSIASNSSLARRISLALDRSIAAEHGDIEESCRGDRAPTQRSEVLGLDAIFLPDFFCSIWKQ